MRRIPSCLVLAVILLGALAEAQCGWAAQCHESARRSQAGHISEGSAVIQLVERSLCCGLVDSKSRRVEETQQVLGYAELSAPLYQSITVPLPDRPPIEFSSNFAPQLSVENDHA